MSLQGHEILTLYRGSDINEALFFLDDNNDPIDMTGHTISVFDAEPWFAANGSVAWSDQAAGEALLAADWANDAPEETWVRLLVKRTSDDYDDGYPKIMVRFL